MPNWKRALIFTVEKLEYLIALTNLENLSLLKLYWPLFTKKWLIALNLVAHGNGELYTVYYKLDTALTSIVNFTFLQCLLIATILILEHTSVFKFIII